MRYRNIEVNRPIKIYNNKRELHPLSNVNKTIKSKTVVSSILEQHFRYGYLKRGYANLNSNRKRFKMPDNEIHKKETIKFEIPIPGQTNKFILEIEQINDISKVDILEWLKKFLKVKKRKQLF